MSDTDPYAGPNVYYPPVEVAAVEPAAPIEEPLAEVEAEIVKDLVADSPEEVPTGTIAEVLAWVGTDRDRAARALAAEEAGQNRKSLIKSLTSGS